MDDTNRKSAHSSPAAYRFGLFILDASAGLLSRNGLRIKLQDQPFHLLALLLEKRGEVVTREEIRERLWESNTFVDFDKSLGVAVLKVREALGDSATNPRFLETVPRRGYRFIAPVSVEFQQANAAASVEAHPASAANARKAVPAGSGGGPKAWRQRLGFAALFVCVAIAAGFTAYRFHLRDSARAEAPSPSMPSQTRMRRSVAVLGFRNLGGDIDQNWLSGAFTEMLNTELAAKGDLRLISGEDVANVKHDLALPAEDTLAKSTLMRLRSSLGADVVVVGSYTLLSDGGKNRIRLDIRTQDTALGETIFEDAISGNENDLFELGSKAGSRIRESLNPSLSLAPASDAPLFPGSSNQLALQFYSEGRERLYEFDFVGARDLLKRAVAADPNFALAHSALSSALSSLGYEIQARDEAKRALQHTQDLPSEVALAIQGQYQESIDDWPNAVLTYQKLFRLFPDNLTYGLHLARAQLHVNPGEAKQTLPSLRALPAPLSDDPRIDLMEASILITQDLPKARAAAEKAIAKASAQRATLMVARGYGILCQQDTMGGESMERSISACTLARNSYLSAGDQYNAARTLNDFAAVYFNHGDLPKAQAMWEQAIEVFRKLEETEGLAASSNNLGDVLLTTGKLAEASRLMKQAISGYKLVGDRSGVALATVDLGEVALQKAELPEAQKDYEQAIAIGTQVGDKSASAYGFAGLGDVYLQQDQLAAARRQYETAIKLRKEIGEKQSILQTRVDLARIAIEEGHAQDAEPEVRECFNQLHQEQLPDDEIDAGLVLADALLNLSKNIDAKNELDALRPVEEKTQNRELQLRFSLEFARALIAERDLNSSRTLLDKVANEAEAGGFAALTWEAQMAQAKVRGEAGDVTGATHQLKSVEAHERNAGFLLLARKADATTRLWSNSGK
jgi:DNA-binding winged helix-turn-helix (wHTH) protein/tetratricopeptide (TPR) repeat protein